MSQKLIEITLHFNDEPDREFDTLAVIGEWDGNEDDSQIFYYFDDNPEVPIVGNHGEFTVTAYKEL